MKKITFLIVLFINSSIFGQMWFENNPQWKYKYYNFDSRVGYCQINVVGTETKGGIECKKLHAVLYLEDFTVPPPTPTPSWTEDLGYFYAYASATGDQVYYYINNQFYTLYDFNANIGDTWVIYNANTNVNCNPAEGTVVVANKGTETINGETLKFIDVYSTGSASLQGRIYQKIGAIDVLFFPEYTHYYPDCGNMPEDASWGQELLCYEEDDFLYNNGTNQCYTIALGLEDIILEDTTYSLYTKNDDLYVKNNKIAKNITLTLYTISGKKVTYKTKNTTTLVQVNTASLSKGIYIAVLTIDNQKIVKKLLVSN